MALTISTPYKTNTVASVSGTTFVSNGTPFAAGDVGRFIELTSGSGAMQYRRITAYTNASTIEIEYSFSTSPHPEFSEVNPSAGDTWRMSYNFDDIDNGTDLIKVNVGQYQATGTVTLSGTAFLADVNISLYMNSINFMVKHGATFILGAIRSNGVTYGGCHIFDLFTSNGGFSGTASTIDTGNVHIHGSTWQCNAVGGFYRLMYTDSAQQRITLQDLRINGHFAGRFFGTKSVLRNLTIANNRNTVVANGSSFTVGPEVPVVKNINVVDSNTVFYYSWGVPSNAASVKVSGVSFDNILNVVAVQGSPTAARTLTVNDVDITALTALPSVINNNASSTFSTYVFSNNLNAAFYDSGSALITESIRCVTKDVASAVTYNITTTSGEIAEQELIYKTSPGNFTGARDWSALGGTTYAPYHFVVASYLYAPADRALSMLESVELATILQDDGFVTETSKTTVDAYTELSNLDRLYDRYKSWFVDNLEVEYPSFGAQKLTGDGSSLDCGNANLVIDATAASVFAVNTGTNTITIKASELLAGTTFTGISTTGTITFSNGAAPGPALVYTDSTGTSVPVTAPNLIDGSRVQIYDVTNSVELSNSLVSGGSGYVGRVSWASDKTIRLRAAYCSGTSAMQVIEATATLTNTGASFTATQVHDAVYEGNAIDGSTVTEFAADYPNVQIDIDDPDGSTTPQRCYAWYMALQMTADGIAYYNGAITAEDASNYRINTAVADMKAQNVSTSPVVVVGGRIYRDDGESLFVAGNGPIQADPGKAYVAEDIRQAVNATLTIVGGI